MMKNQKILILNRISKRYIEDLWDRIGRKLMSKSVLLKDIQVAIAQVRAKKNL